MTDDPRKAPDVPEDFTIFFEKGLPVGLVHGFDLKRGRKISDSVELFTTLNQIGRKHGKFVNKLTSSQAVAFGLTHNLYPVPLAPHCA